MYINKKKIIYMVLSQMFHKKTLVLIVLTSTKEPDKNHFLQKVSAATTLSNIMGPKLKLNLHKEWVILI